ncbi:hypothetical protein H4Q26_000992 [Puccinia striiformis f. sp. tritici PST-130]|nr:hypothetical protein H4Q26_000992 [Puccinia striiformis f. sp. tritici PST-130]
MLAVVMIYQTDSSTLSGGPRPLVDAPNPQRHQTEIQMTYKNPILAGFSRLMNKFQPSFYGKWTHYQNFFDDAFSALSIDQVRTQEGLLDRMQLSLLPLLDDQIKTLSSSLNPGDVWKEPIAKRQLILRTMSALEHTIDQIKFIIASTCPACKGPLTSAPERTDDHDCRGLKSYRLQRLELKFNGEVLYQINQVFTHARELFQKTVLAPDAVKPDKLDESSDRKLLAKWVDLASKSIKSTIKEFESSELDLAQESWQFELSKIDDIFGEIIHTAYQPGTDLVTEDGRRYSRAPVHEPVVRLAQGIVPIIKLVKIFYKKTSQRGMNQRRFPLFTKMSSQQILSMAHSIGTFHGDVLKLRLLYQELIRGSEPSYALHYIPLISVTDGPELRAYYITWFETWSDQFYLAIRNFKRLAKRFDSTPF